MSDPLPLPATFTHAEVVRNYQTRVNVLEKAMTDIASCATQCLCCEMHRRIAVEALGHDVEIVTDTLDI